MLVTTSKLLITGADAQMVKNVVLDASINSMTEFKQIIGRRTRVREDLGKMFYTIFDFRRATRLFADPDFDGPVEQDEEFPPALGGEIPPLPNDPPEQPGDAPPPNGVNTGGEDSAGKRIKYYVHDVLVTVLKEQVQYIDKDGKLISKSLTDYTRRSIRSQYATLNDFLAEWNAAEH